MKNATHLPEMPTDMNSTQPGYRAQAVIVLTCFLTLVICCSSIRPVSASDTRLKIGIIGDQTGTPDIQAAYAILDKGAAILSTKEVQGRCPYRGPPRKQTARTRLPLTL